MALFLMPLPENEIFLELRDGECYRVQVSRSWHPIPQDVAVRMAESSGVTVQSLFDAAALSPSLSGHVGVKHRATYSVYTLPIAMLPMRARFRLVEKTMVPDFQCAVADSQMIYLEWKVPTPAMRVFLLVTVTPPAEPNTGHKMYSSLQHLVAMDSAGRIYRMPTSNTFDDCKLCTGNYDTQGITVMDCLIKAMEQFSKSEWQQDLAGRGGSEGAVRAQKMFRYKPLEDGFEQLESTVISSWTELCIKVGNEYVLSHIVI